MRIPADDGVFMKNFEKQLDIVETFAKKHGKIVTVVKTGAANDPAPGDNQTVLLKSGNGNKDWYNQILNIVSKSEAPYFLLWANFSKSDGFENYYGVNDQMTRAWTTNADSNCQVTLELTKSKKSEGSYGLKFTYDETATGWGGATISKEVDWSKCDALQFYTIPDEKNQKAITKYGHCCRIQ